MAERSFHLITLGCKVNQYEGHALRESWLAQGLRETPRPEEASCLVVNSCAVTAKAVADVRNAVRRLNRAAPATPIVITGCAAQTLREELLRLPGVAAVIGQKDKDALLDWFAAMESEDTQLVPQTCECGGDTAPHPPTQNAGAGDRCPLPGVGGAHIQNKVASTKNFPPFTVSGYDRSRAVLKIQDGCSHRCTYCIVPLARGAAVSRPLEASLAEARRLLAAGFREIVISGVNLRQYGRDLPSPHDFWDFLEALERELAPEWAGRARFRISSLEPGQLGEKALAVLAESRLTAPHLHLSLQSGSPSVLRRMGRGHYGPGGITDFLRSLRDVWPVFGLGADILTGFPGESEEEAVRTLELCAALPLTYAHVFPYSRRPGTAAATMPDQVPQEVKKARAAALRALVRARQTVFLQALAGLPRVHVVFEDREEHASAPRGVNEFYADCVLENTPAVQGNAGTDALAAFSFRGITAAVPVRAAKGTLVVRLCDTAPSADQENA